MPEELVIEVEEGGKLRSVLEENGVSAETVIVERGGEVIPLQEYVEDGEELRVLEVVSGG